MILLLTSPSCALHIIHIGYSTPGLRRTLFRFALDTLAQRREKTCWRDADSGMLSFESWGIGLEARPSCS
jgi:hypothetical protein